MHTLQIKNFRICILFLLLFLVIPSFVVAQRSSSESTVATKSWTKFFEEFSAAVKKKNKSALKKLMDPDFFGGLGGYPSRDEWLNHIVADNLWSVLQKSVSKGTISTYALGRGDESSFIKYKTKRIARETKDGE